ncbi:MAG TPA: PucR family transcriptional regulator ligand-binding domain-containing protein [Baekduia sp.]|uniref:PucR family transcriptional regulator n=1 Tax=Baekduia sp. TaxID=2600305 RepID=UPI002D7893DC|nr:PucR family transcriptional regulator ligand-binding domain-containing protein [Baekduia sp.]HET6509103.1 PucR family transcriptional regulator ligand-binding domain-containing protein [Baekduia sp.]
MGRTVANAKVIDLASRRPGIVVGDLLGMAHLRTRCVAGARGLDRVATWAHVYDVPEPWEWLAPGELVLSNGFGIPAGARAQREYLTRLDDAGAVGLAIAEGHHGPPLTDELRATADRLAFPLLETAWEVSYAMIARAVAEAGRDQSGDLLARTQRVYGALSAAAAAGRSGGDLLAEVAASQGCRAVVLDRRTGQPLMGTGTVARPLIDQAVASMRGDGRSAANAIRVTCGQERGYGVGLPREQDAMLLICHRHGRAPEPVIARHLAAVAAGELERMTVERRREQDRGAVVLRDIVAGESAGDLVMTELEQRALVGELLVAAVDVVDRDPELRRLYLALSELGAAPLTLLCGDRALLVITTDAAVTERMLAMVDDPRHIGISEPFADAGRIVQAVQQALWSLGLARTTGERVVRHAEQRLAAFLPASVGEARQVVDRILGAVIAHDEEKGAGLVESLRVFLACNRSWQNASRQLFMHKQTLVYRMHKVEELTGLKLDRTDDVTQLWLALRTRELLL